jgi:hypothetical protein
MTSFKVWYNEDKCISDTTSSQDNSQIYHLNIEQTVLHDKKNGTFSRNLIPRVHLYKNPLLSNNFKPLFLGKITRH